MWNNVMITAPLKNAFHYLKYNDNVPGARKHVSGHIQHVFKESICFVDKINASEPGVAYMIQLVLEG